MVHPLSSDELSVRISWLQTKLIIRCENDVIECLQFYDQFSYNKLIKKFKIAVHIALIKLTSHASK